MNHIKLHTLSRQINILLEQIKLDTSIEVMILAYMNLQSCKNSIANTLSMTANNKTMVELLDEYEGFGLSFTLLIPNIKNDDNLKYAKQIAIHYLDIAKLFKDTHISKQAFDIADELTISNKKEDVKEKTNWKGYMIDPSTGWKYGFPKDVKEDCYNITEWLIQNGYPKPLLNETNPIRVWKQPYTIVISSNNEIKTI